MDVRQILLRFAIVGVLAVVAFLAFTTTSSTPSAEAVRVRPNCEFAIPPLVLWAQGGGADTVTCTFSIRGNDHTLVVDFTLNPGERPPLTIDDCTLDLQTIHVGPCP